MKPQVRLTMGLVGVLLFASHLSLRAADPATTTPAEGKLSNLWTRQTGQDWTTFLGPTGDSKSAETGIVAPWPKEGPKLVWTRRVGTGYGIGSTSRGRYYHFDRWDPRPRAPSGKARLTCMHAETGKELWRFEYDTQYEDLLGYNNGPRCSPVIEGNRVYIYGAEGMLHCLRANDGKPIWNVNTVKKYGVVQNFFGVGSTPVIEGDLLICMVGGSPPGSPQLYASNGNVDGNGSGVVAFNKYTGKEVYKITDELASYASLKTTSIDGRRWGLAFCRGGLVGFEPSSGKVHFQYPWRSRMLESVNASMPVVNGNDILVSECYQIGSSLLTIKGNGYEVTWKDDRRKREKALRAHWNTPIYLDGYLYGCSGRNKPDADLRCIEWKTGKVKWVKVFPGFLRERSSLLYVDGHFIYQGELGVLRLIKANPEKYDVVSEVVLRDPDEKEQPRALLREPCWAAPILSHGLLYVRGDERLACLELIPAR
ncbi:MAG: hypothetical protein CMJ70_00700 [Planctomycetaceae bacterium]|nr:hypothetical protein [Planctomycetaceae bacterium]HAA71224.1 hypothetical protein [Planctomycetaceae bacterium]|tara:strand:- start:7274 stop:8719 length:1446 start_codon:yes stop_codon:yes gene_type:complete